MKQVLLQGKIIGYQEGGKLGYFNSKTPDSPFSNFYRPPKPLKICFNKHAKPMLGIDNNHKMGEFDSVEQFFAYGKAVEMHDLDTAKKIYHTHTNSSFVFKKLGRSVKNFDADKWNKEGKKWMLAGMYAKYTQDPFARHALLATKDLDLVEANPYDKKWGVGNDINHFANGTGKNYQGRLTSFVRDKYIITKQCDINLSGLKTDTQQL